jgi:hypothetical protein
MGHLHNPTDIGEKCVSQHPKVLYDKNRIDPLMCNAPFTYTYVGHLQKPQVSSMGPWRTDEHQVITCIFIKFTLGIDVNFGQKVFAQIMSKHFIQNCGQ